MIKVLLRQKLKNKFPEIDFDVLTPPNPETGDYSTNIAFILAKKYHRSPEEVGKEIIEEIERDGDIQKVFERIEFAKPGFINFYLKDDFLRKQMRKIGSDKSFGYNETMKGKTVMVEYTDPNPFKLFHIGHLMSNTIGEAITRLYEASGARVLRANYQGDVGLHAAKTIWAILISPAKDSFPEEDDQLEKKIEYLGEAYAVGARSYEENEEAKTRIEEINKKIYDRSDESINKAYDLGKKWSLEYFETIYKKLGTKFDHYFFESETGKDGLEVISENKKVFTESEGALIFKGEDH
ncbi:arginine--tRNA ligase, partial [Candidatus Roizmanbacteria bacterium]|nr:arginine--tRNA ligase [Candidatus Roizmanbacteria bacterium]